MCLRKMLVPHKTVHIVTNTIVHLFIYFCFADLSQKISCIVCFTLLHLGDRGEEGDSFYWQRTDPMLLFL